MSEPSSLRKNTVGRRDFLAGFGVALGGLVLLSAGWWGRLLRPEGKPDPQRLGLRQGSVPKPPAEDQP
jgi:hypothetical protein